ncbi:MAG: CoA transferase, partial [Dehalococcoidales bacterium]|nr:CoA transferase [Dehalococcoidales bacterium]
MTRKLLEGVKICDFTRVIVGPLTTKTLSDYGAEVIRIEGRSNLGIFRIQAPHPDLSAQFN